MRYATRGVWSSAKTASQPLPKYALKNPQTLSADFFSYISPHFGKDKSQREWFCEADKAGIWENGQKSLAAVTAV